LVEFKREAHEDFQLLVQKMYTEVGARLMQLEKMNVEVVEQAPKQVIPSNVNYQHGELETGVAEEAAEMERARKVVDPNGREIRIESVSSGKEKVGRNDPCPCGSGKKFKHCHGRANA
jgi:preprotein translocase subunit SecA